jgi:hypothetical protein
MYRRLQRRTAFLNRLGRTVYKILRIVLDAKGRTLRELNVTYSPSSSGSMQGIVEAACFPLKTLKISSRFR